MPPLHRCLLTVLILSSGALAADWKLELQADRLLVRDGSQPVCEYRFDDSEIPRPYFCHVHAPGGVQVTRSHPPGPHDLSDHATFHPGIWVAFGDLSGADSWRLQGTVEHAGFIEEPRVSAESVNWTVENRYQHADGTPVCTEICRWSLDESGDSYRLTLDSRFTSDREFAFGDQEEMGLGVRLATALAENQEPGGSVLDSEGRTGAAGAWGRQADWCDYSGVVEGRAVGVTVMGHPLNFRRSWWHVRDYGLLTANPFGRAAFTGGEQSRIRVARGEHFRLRYRIVLHNSSPAAGYDPAAAFADYVAVE